jgi:hypothetical protein
LRAARRIPPPDFFRRLLALRRPAQQKNDIDNIFTTTARLCAQKPFLAVQHDFIEMVLIQSFIANYTFEGRLAAPLSNFRNALWYR